MEHTDLQSLRDKARDGGANDKTRLAVAILWELQGAGKRYGEEFIGELLDESYRIPQNFDDYMAFIRHLEINSGSLQLFMEFLEIDTIIPERRRDLARFVGLRLLDKSGVQDKKNAVQCLDKAVGLGDGHCALMLGNVFETGAFSFHMKDFDYLPDPEAAFHYYQKGAELNHRHCWLKCARYYRQGKGVVKNERKAFYWMLKAACSHVHEAKSEISKYFEHGTGTRKNPCEAYVWALLAGVSVGPSAYEHLEGVLTEEERYRAQEEAEARNALSSPELYDRVLAQLSQSGNAPADVASPTAGKSKPGFDLRGWNVSTPDDLRKVKLYINSKENNVVLKYERHTQRFACKDFCSRFSLCEFRLLMEYGGCQKGHNACQIGYYGDSIAQSLTGRVRTRSNQKVVTDFNCHFRRLFGLDKGIKPFVWLPGVRGDSSAKSLKANFEIIFT